MSIMDPSQGGAPPEMPPPPELGGGNPMAALMGAPPPGMAPPPGIAEEEASPEEGDETSDVQEAIEALKRAIDRPTTDQQEMAVYQTCIANLQKQMGKNESMLDNALGTNPQLRKALAGGGG
jgi:hypothetical protein